MLRLSYLIQNSLYPKQDRIPPSPRPEKKNSRKGISRKNLQSIPDPGLVLEAGRAQRSLWEGSVGLLPEEQDGKCWAALLAEHPIPLPPLPQLPASICTLGWVTWVWGCYSVISKKALRLKIRQLGNATPSGQCCHQGHAPGPSQVSSKPQGPDSVTSPG